MAFVHILPEAVMEYTEGMSSSENEVIDEHDDHRLLKSLGLDRNLQDHEEETHLEEEAEAHEEHEEHEGHEAHLFPLPYLLFFAGYTLVLFIDRVAS